MKKELDCVMQGLSNLCENNAELFLFMKIWIVYTLMMIMVYYLW